MLTFHNLKDAGVYHGITDASFPNITKEGGLQGKLTKGYTPIQMEQVHDNVAMIAVEGDDGVIEGSDAVISGIQKHLLIVRTKKKVSAAVHGGRKGITWGIIGQAVQCMKVLGCEPENILVGIGPHIRVKNYEIRDDVIQHIEGSVYKEFIQARDGKMYFDLTEAVHADLVEENILLHNIEDCGIDTYSDYEKYFSYRRWCQDKTLYGGTYKAFGSFIAV
jgi:copper oxidase (laccase) domain-containing protein